MGILNLFLAASMPVLKVLLVTAVGSFLALDRIKILTEDARKHLNTVRNNFMQSSKLCFLLDNFMLWICGARVF